MTMLKVPVSSADHVQGPDGAVVTLVEYGDYECPSLRRWPTRSSSACRSILATGFGLCFATFPCANCTPTRRRRPKPRSSPQRMESSGRCTTCSMRTSSASSDALLLELARGAETARGGADPGAGRADSSRLASAPTSAAASAAESTEPQPSSSMDFATTVPRSFPNSWRPWRRPRSGPRTPPPIDRIVLASSPGPARLCVQLSPCVYRS